MKETELKPCPFCGGVAEIKRGNSYWVLCVQAHCTKCGASTSKVPIDHTIYTLGKQVKFTEEHAIQKATNDWNRRTDDEQREAD